MIEVQAPSAARRYSYGVGPVSAPPSDSGSSAGKLVAPDGDHRRVAVRAGRYANMPVVRLPCARPPCGRARPAAVPTGAHYVPSGPYAEHARRILRVRPVRQQVVRRIQGDEALRVLGVVVDSAGALDADCGVDRRVHDREGRVQMSESVVQRRRLQIIEKGRTNGERPPRDRHGHLTTRHDFVILLGDVLDYVGQVRGRTYGRNRPYGRERSPRAGKGDMIRRHAGAIRRFRDGGVVAFPSPIPAAEVPQREKSHHPLHSAQLSDYV